MKISIISDTHDNIANLNKAIAITLREKTETLIHCGDINSIETVKEIKKLFSGKIYITFGNADENNFPDIENLKKDFPEISFFKEIGELNIEGKNIAFTHFPETAKELALLKKYDLVFHGHTHKPWEEKIERTRMVNPGNVAGTFYKPTFAIYDANNDKLELKIL